jgi:methylphosphotriester-DNA--protein-cysteine methyltransferase
MEGLARAGVRYVGSDTTHIYCLPTCHNAKRITDRHRVLFKSATAGIAAGYHACSQCRPVAVAA